VDATRVLRGNDSIWKRFRGISTRPTTQRGTVGESVELKGIEPSASRVRFWRSPS
jgi:hypothetical protein